MRIQVTEAMFAALTASNHGYIMKQRGEVEIKVTQQLLDMFLMLVTNYSIYIILNSQISQLESQCSLAFESKQ